MQRYIKRSSTGRQPAWQSMTGATLVEAMVALVVLSIGLLGLASLQLTGISNNANADNRTTAALIANDMVERMRANRDGVKAGNYGAINYGTIDCMAAPAAYCEDSGIGPAASCSPVQVASFDAYITTCRARAMSQGAALAVGCSDNTGLTPAACDDTTFRTVTVNWVNQTDNGSANKSLTMVFKP